MAPSCETKPIRPRLHPATGSNGTKQTQSGPTSPEARLLRSEECKTNPIWAGPAGGRVVGGRERPKRTQFGATPPCNRLEWHQTKPMAGSIVRNKANCRSGPPEGAAKGRRLCETKPIPGCARWDRTTGTWDAGQMSKTKPNLGELGHLGDGAGGLLCKTKPISGWQRQAPACRRFWRMRWTIGKLRRLRLSLPPGQEPAESAIV
jgi:hypothetical protein